VRETTHLLHAIPALLQFVHDADDDVAALEVGCAWLERHAGVDRAAMVTADCGRMVVKRGWTVADLESGDLGTFVRSAQPTAAGGPGVLARAPILSAGVPIGHVIARSRWDATSTVEEAVLSVAVICAPAFRSRLDAVALSAEAHTRVPEILGRSPGIAGVRESIVRSALTSFAVLIEGESGTGKELVARALHRLSRRRSRRFCAINCAALTDDLVEAELFGFARGAFTGAVGHRAGLFEEADGGTLFLDEVSELSSRAQAKLLRTLQEREIRRLGENAARTVDVRIVAATNRPLADVVARGSFREDLMFRLAVVRVRMPTLRERVEDVPPLAQFFWRQVSTDANKRATLGPDAITALCRHTWPGNVRELQNVISALAVAAPARGRVTARHVAQVIVPPAEVPAALGPLGSARRTFERRAVAAALARHGGRRSAAARELGLSRQGLAKAIKRLGLAAPGVEGVA
jgi:transcriptional regulator with PAS, ATPase and Fis domain